MANVTLASRELKNKHTGIDIYVPQHETVPGLLGGNVLYHVIVVTQLFYFKTQGKYKESDVVQFMIPQKFSTFEELYHKLLKKFSSVVFCSLPKKALIINDFVISERQHVMEDVMHQIARTPKLSCSSLVLEFLGVHQSVRDSSPSDEKETSTNSCNKKQYLSKDDAVEEVDLFAVYKHVESEPVKNKEKDFDFLLFAKSAKTANNDTSIFKVVGNEEEEEDEDTVDFLISADAVSLETRNNSHLLNVEDKLAKLLATEKPKKPTLREKPVPKPRMKPKPQLKPKPASKPRFEDTTRNDDIVKTCHAKIGEEDIFVPKKGYFRKLSHDKETLDDIFKCPAKPIFPSTNDDDDDDLFKSSSDQGLAKMNAEDISSYIQQNTLQSDDSLDLF